MAPTLIDLLLPSLREVKITVSFALFLIAVILIFEHISSSSSPSKGGGRSEGTRLQRATARAAADEIVVLEPEDQAEINQLNEEPQGTQIFAIKVELLAAKNLSGSNLSGTSNSYAIISCDQQKRFSSMKPSRNPLWGEEFNFFVNELPVQISVTICDWDVIQKSTIIGSVALKAQNEGQSGAVWYSLDVAPGEVCIHTSTYKLPEKFFRSFSNFIVADARKRIASQVHNKPGSLQIIFNLPPDEVVWYSYSCALERSFLYHGRMYISAWHVCFHSNVFSKQLKVVIPFGDIYKIKRSQHACINPAITIVLHLGSGGHGVPPLASPDGRARYKFASFWNRNNSLRALQQSIKLYRAFLEAEKQERLRSTMNFNSNPLGGGIKKQANNEESVVATRKVQAFLNEKILASVVKETFPCTAEQFFTLLLSDNSSFIKEFQSARKDTNIKLDRWHIRDDYDGQVRDVRYRSLCNSPLCPPETEVTEWQHAALSSNKTTLVFEMIQQAHDVPFGSYFEIHTRWSMQTISECSCLLDVSLGINFKKWCILQSRIKSGATEESKKEVKRMLEAAHVYLLMSKYTS